MLNIYFLELHPLYTFIALFKKKLTPRTSMISVFLFKKKTYSKIKVYCKQNRHFYRDCFAFFFNFILVYRSLWTIDRSQRVEEKKNIDLLSVKYGIWYLLASLKKMSLAKHGELYFILASTCFSPLAKKLFPTQYIIMKD